VVGANARGLSFLVGGRGDSRGAMEVLEVVRVRGLWTRASEDVAGRGVMLRQMRDAEVVVAGREVRKVVKKVPWSPRRHSKLLRTLTSTTDASPRPTLFAHRGGSARVPLA
jgi:hypothetical protein